MWLVEVLSLVIKSNPIFKKLIKNKQALVSLDDSSILPVGGPLDGGACPNVACRKSHVSCLHTIGIPYVPKLFHVDFKKRLRRSRYIPCKI